MSKTTEKLNINDLFTRKFKTPLRKLVVNTELLFHEKCAKEATAFNRVEE